MGNVECLKAQLSLLEGVDVEQLNLFCSGAPLEDEVHLAALENHTIDLNIPLLGGKVHGSLARAGKVRGQTPRLRPRRRRKRRLAGQRGGSSTTGGSSTWSRPSAARRDPTPTPKLWADFSLNPAIHGFNKLNLFQK